MAKKATQKPMTKTEVLNALVEKTELSKKEVGGVLEALAELIGEQLGKKGPGVFSLPGLLKITKQHKPAVKGGEEKINAFTGEPYLTKPKPAHNVVKVRPLKNLKDMV